QKRQDGKLERAAVDVSRSQSIPRFRRYQPRCLLWLRSTDEQCRRSACNHGGWATVSHVSWSTQGASGYQRGSGLLEQDRSPHQRLVLQLLRDTGTEAPWRRGMDEMECSTERGVDQ